MPVLESKLNPRGEDFVANKDAMRVLVDDLRAQTQQVSQGGGHAAREKHLARGKMLPRDRVAHLLDPGTPFLELSPLAAHGMYHGDAPGAGIITGIGRIAGIE
jgi:3-methylcrotonyl-CoA carboxylase beta subunit